MPGVHGASHDRSICLVPRLRDVGALGLSDGLKQFPEPGGVDVEGLAPGDTGELDRAENVAVVLVVADDPAFADHRAIDGEVGAALDQA